MNEWQKTHNKVKMYKELYPKGTRVMLLHMGDDDPNPVEDGTRGTVVAVDDTGTVHCVFDSGRSLGLVPDADSFRRLTEAELAEEQTEQPGGMEMGM